ncbi:MAG: hypothetical protein A2Y15_00760 [Clostridiales bacterium GWF2_36_10]|nr:MAG: hypothetical protein A2Y15_00760 [Clostridiales bacterium GWF2_36_10]HAN21501.1 hypothetical protein [Clostridiales bacterium]
MKKETKIIILVALVFALLIGVVAFTLINSNSGKNNSDESSATSQISVSDQSVASDTEETVAESVNSEEQFSKTIIVLVKVEGNETKTFTIGTDAEFLLDALNQIDLVEGEDSEYGFFITAVDGVAANEDKQEWWGIYEDGNMTQTGVSTTPIEDGDTFELILSK